MKKLGIVVLYLLFLTSCGDDPIPPTSFSVINMSSNTIYGFTTYYTDDEILKEKYQHGNLEPGDTTNNISTEHYAIDFYYSYDPGGVKFYSGIPFTLNLHANNILAINDKTFVKGGTTYYIKNNTGLIFLNAVSFFLSGDNKSDQVYHGEILPDTRSAIFSTSRDQISIEFQIELGGDKFRVVDPYTIYQNGLNELRVEMNTTLIRLPP